MSAPSFDRHATEALALTRPASHRGERRTAEHILLTILAVLSLLSMGFIGGFVLVAWWS